MEGGERSRISLGVALLASVKPSGETHGFLTDLRGFWLDEVNSLFQRKAVFLARRPGRWLISGRGSEQPLSHYPGSVLEGGPTGLFHLSASLKLERWLQLFISGAVVAACEPERRARVSVRCGGRSKVEVTAGKEVRFIDFVVGLHSLWTVWNWVSPHFFSGSPFLCLFCLSTYICCVQEPHRCCIHCPASTHQLSQPFQTFRSPYVI